MPTDPGFLARWRGTFLFDVFRRFVVLLFLATLLVGGATGILYYRDLASERRTRSQVSLLMVELQVVTIGREMDSVASDLLYLAAQADLKSLLTGQAGSQRRLEAEYLAFLALKRTYDQIRLLTEEGAEVIRIKYNDGAPAVVPDGDLQSEATREYFQRTIRMAPGQVYVSPLELNLDHGRIERPLKPVVRFATLVQDQGGRRRGLLVLNYLGDKLLDRLTDMSANFRGSVLLLNRSGFYLKGARAEDEWGFVFGNDRTFARDHPDAWPRMSDRQYGQFLSHEGLFTFQRLQLGQPPYDTLTVVAHVPKALLRQGSRRLLDRVLLVFAVVAPAMVLLVWYLSYTSLLRRKHEQQIKESEARLRTLSAELLNAQERDRSSIARDLHDDLGQLVTAVSLDLARAQQMHEAERKDRLIGKALAEMQLLLDRLHAIASRIRPRILDDLGLKEAVRSYLTEYEDRTGIVTQADLKFDGDEIPPGISENVYRILQEALTNVSKHAQAPAVFVGLQATRERVVLNVKDEGIGFRPAVTHGGLGLLGIRERVELLGGTLELRSERGAGTELRVIIPVREASRHEDEGR